MSVFFTDFQICKYRFEKLRVEINSGICYIKSVESIRHGKEDIYMKIDDSIFAVKLYEMAEQYGKLQCRIRVCEQGDSRKIREELKKAEEELEENTLLLQEKTESCRSEAVRRMSQVQLDYRKKTQDLMTRQLVQDIHYEDSTVEEDEREAELLYAEYAMDFATLAMQQAMISVLTALENQKDADKQRSGKTPG